jgi:hypothetical protein
MNPELEKYIDMALVDGVIKEDEKAFLIKKADQLGVEKDEFDFILNTKIQMKQKEFQESVPPPPPPPQNVSANTEKKSQKHGNLKKCPSCGAHVDSSSLHCKECDVEFVNISGNDIIKEIKEEIENIKKEGKKEGLDKYDYEDYVIENTIDLIQNISIPNSKENLFELLSYMSGKAISSSADTDDDLLNAYHGRALEVITKLRIVSQNDENLMKQVDSIELKMKQIKSKNNRNTILMIFISLSVSVGMIYGIYLLIKSAF